MMFTKIGHNAAECKNPRKIDRSAMNELKTEEAWAGLVKAVKERDIDDVKEAVQVYVKSQPDLTYVDLEKALREQEQALYLIAVKKEALLTSLTNMDLQGNLDREYTVTYRFDDKPARPRERNIWPKDGAENLKRLENAGEVVDRGIPKCTNCGELGHISKHCTQEKNEAERVVIKCYNCDKEGHRIRDCRSTTWLTDCVKKNEFTDTNIQGTEARVDKFACKNCGKGGHKAADCKLHPVFIYRMEPRLTW
jgi:hypothetical protein